MKANVSLPPEEVPMAIGKNASNIKLAKALTGYDIEVFRDIDEGEEEEDILLDEFGDEIDQWILDTLKNIGCSTAKSVLRIPRERLEKRTDLEMSTINHVLDILSSEFDAEELDEIGYRTLESEASSENEGEEDESLEESREVQDEYQESQLPNPQEEMSDTSKEE